MSKIDKNLVKPMRNENVPAPGFVRLNTIGEMYQRSTHFGISKSGTWRVHDEEHIPTENSNDANSTLILMNWGFIENWKINPPHEKCEVVSDEELKPTHFTYKHFTYKIDSKYLIELMEKYDTKSYEHEGQIYIWLDVKGKRCNPR